MSSLRSFSEDSVLGGYFSGTRFRSGIENSFACKDLEGWGPFSKTRSDFTPCFLDTAVLGCAVVGIFVSIRTLWVVVNGAPSPSKLGHGNTDLVSRLAAGLVCTSVAQGLSFSLAALSWLDDIRFWRYLACLISFSMITTAHYFETQKSPHSSDLLTLFWLLLFSIYSMDFRSLLIGGFYDLNSTYILASIISICLVTFQFVLLWIVPQSKDSVNVVGLECPLESAALPSKFTFGWVSPLMKTGYAAAITEGNLWHLCEKDSAKSTATKFRTAWERRKSKKPMSIWVAILHAFGGKYLCAGFYQALSDIITIAQPQLLRVLIRFISNYQSNEVESKTFGFLIAFSMFFLLAIKAICLNQYEFNAELTGLHVQSALTVAIYEKTTRLSSIGRSKYPSGTILNHVAVDIQSVKKLAEFGHKIWSAPLQVILTLFSLYRIIGPGMLLGVGALVLIIPLNTIVMKLLQGVQVEQMMNRDMRTKLLTEILLHIKSIKLLGWLPAFMSKLSTLRNERELTTLRRQGVFLAFANLIWSMGPFLVSFLSITVFVLTKHTPLRADVVFPALALFNLLHNPLAAFPYAVSAVVDAHVAIARISKFIEADELQHDAVTWRASELIEDDEVITIRDAIFSWDQKVTKPSLEIPELTLHQNELYCLVGSVGSGKSTLLQALLGEVFKFKGTVKFRGSVAYVAQVPWIISGSIKENILFGHDWDQELYYRIINACALKDDLSSLTEGDKTQVGGQGMNLSGGQKARVALARALYARADVYLLDDVLSAVDQHVRNHLIKNVLGPHGMLRNKTRILATNSRPALQESGLIIMLHEGKILEMGTFQAALSNHGNIANLVQKHSYEADADTISDAPTQHAFNNSTRARSTVAESERLGCPPISQLRRRKKAQMVEKVQKGELPKNSAVKRHNGDKIEWKLYKTYFRASSPTAIFFCLIILVLERLAVAGSDVWIKIWTEAGERYGGNDRIWLCIGVYFTLGFGSAALGAIQMLVLLVFCSLRASKTLHEAMARATFHSPMSFFETTSFGKIMTRFSSDMYRIDDRLGRMFNSMLIQVIKTVIMLAIISAATPSIVVAIIPLGILYFWTQRYYIRTSRELSRLESESKGLAYTHIQSTIAGICTIRAFRHLSRFKNELEQHIDTNQRAYFANQSVNRWLSIRLEFIGAATTFFTACLAIVVMSPHSGASAAMIGLALVNAQRITSILNIQIQSVAVLENHAVSLERVVEFIELPSEGAGVDPDDHPPATWPEKGAVFFHNYSTRYRDGLEEALQNINLDIRAGERVGIVGRTGAGKSSLTMALFRIVEPTQGHIEIDGLNTSLIPLQTLRSRIAIIPQDASIFTGTVRTNLDPLSVHDDTEIWTALSHAQLSSHIAGLPERLSTPIEESGSNFSGGQRQLLSLARALLRDTSILVLDEATASVDLETDRILQEMLKGDVLKGRTIITVAHRIETILDSDRVVVLEKGRVVEFGTPRELMGQARLFYKLVIESGLEDKVSY